MHKLTDLTAAVLVPLALTFPTTAAFAQQRPLKESIVGSWTIVSAVDKYEDGKSNNPWGPGLKGNIIFDGSGRFAQIIIGGPEASMKTADPRRPDAYVVAYYGTYTVNEADKLVTTKLEYASYSARAGSELGWKVTGDNDVLTLIGTPRKDQLGTFSPNLEVKRAK
jgi:hypothetical protein